MSMLERGLRTIGLRQRSYQSLFAEPNHKVLAELALYSNAFRADVDGLSHDMIMIMHGRRQMFFHIVDHLKLSVDELEALYVSLAARPAQARRAAASFPMPTGEDE